MIVQCPNCDTKYRLDETLLGKDGEQVRCIRCGHVFRVHPPQPDDEINVVQDEDFDWLKDMDVAGGVEKEEDEVPAPAEDFGPGYEKKNGAIAVEIPSSEPKRTRALTWVMIAIAVVSLISGVVLYFPELQNTVRSWFGSEAPEEVRQEQHLGEEQISLISLQNVRQYFVSNEKIGQLFVIEGKARNGFSSPMELIKIEANLFDAQGEVVERRELLAGNTVSLFQLQILSEEELQAALQAKVGILSNNTNLRPGMDVPFMVVFPNPPESVQEYGLKVIEAQHPPQ